MRKKDDINKSIEKIKRNLKDSPKESLKLVESVSKQVNTIKNETERAKLYYKLGMIYRDLSKNLESIEQFKLALTIYEQIGGKIPECYYNIGQNFAELYIFEEAEKYFTLTLNASSETGDIEIHSKCSENLGVLYIQIGNYSKALEMLFYSLKIFKKENYKRNIASSLTNIGICFTEIGLYDKSIEYHLKAVEIGETLDDKKLLAMIYINIAVVYQSSNNYELALEYYFKSLKLSEEVNDNRSLSNNFNNIGDVYEKQKKYDLALNYFLKAKKVTDESNKHALSIIFANLAKSYIKLGKYNEVFRYLERAIELAERINMKEIKLHVYEGAKEIYFETKELLKAFEYQKKYYEIKESILNAETAKKIEEDLSGKLNELYRSKDFENETEFPEIIGHSKDMKDVFSMIKMVAEHNVNVLITGPTGSGKELVAKAIHKKYKKDSPFVAINCSAIPEHLLESELFGYTKGAFTGAFRDKKGKIETANNGTLFLDEIGDMPLSLQSKILHVIQERIVTPIGSTKSVPVSIRVISATHRDLHRMINNKEFRQDLFYRLNVIGLEIPALKDRRIDIPLLLNHFIRKYNKKFDKKIRSVSIDAQNYLISLSWPGNVRELENKIEKAVLLSEKDTLHIDLFTDKSQKESDNIFENLPVNWTAYKSYKNKITNKLDTSYVKELLLLSNNNVLVASKHGSLDPRQIYRILEKVKKT